LEGFQGERSGAIDIICSWQNTFLKKRSIWKSEIEIESEREIESEIEIEREKRKKKLRTQ
jgi:hypothetical protein